MTKATANVEGVTQGNAASAEQSASAFQELAAKPAPSEPRPCDASAAVPASPAGDSLFTLSDEEWIHIQLRPAPPSLWPAAPE